MARRLISSAFAVYVLLTPIAGALQARDSESLPTVAEFVDGLEAQPGFVEFYWDDSMGKIWLKLDRLDEELLYVRSLSAGVGSNDIGLDRGQLGATHVVRFRRVGRKVLVEQPNYRYRAITPNPDERRAVEEAFASSTLWGFEVAAEEDGAVVVEATDFLLRDAHGIARRLKERQQGSYKLDASRSAVYRLGCKAFPKNTELEASLTFVGEPAGAWIRSVTPTPEAVTVRQHHSFIALPEEGYQPRQSDPRAGYGEIFYYDYATPIGAPLRQGRIRRHRLEKRSPQAERSKAVEPIVYYLDRGAPEPIRSALLDGARWWNQAFEAIGFEDAFRVEMMPQGADPLDVRYNVIQWVHRATRGWSYGSSVTDPRTGEILKGHVTLGSLRVRQDYMIAEGLLSPYGNSESGRNDPESQKEPVAMAEMALARLRQLSAHEVGHTLGLSHNFAASSYGRASVMDYPHPQIDLAADGTIDLSNAYAEGLGDWDLQAIRYGYSHFPPGTDEAEALETILSDGARRGLLFVTDRDARSVSGAHPRGHLWDNGASAASELERLLTVRQTALGRFSERSIPPGTPWSRLEDLLVPIYLLHRYQTQAAAKLLGGVDYTYGVRGDGQTVTEPVAAADQRHALDALLETLKAEQLDLSPAILRLIPPRPPGFTRGRENFHSRSGLTFDPLAAAEAAAELSLGQLLHPQRSSRLVQQHAVDTQLPGLNDVLDGLSKLTWERATPPGLLGEVKRVVDRLYLTHLMRLAADPRTSGQVRALAGDELVRLDEQIAGARGAAREEQAHRNAAHRRLQRFFEDPSTAAVSVRLTLPSGDPIGAPADVRLGCSHAH